MRDRSNQLPVLDGVRLPPTALLTSVKVIVSITDRYPKPGTLAMQVLGLLHLLRHKSLSRGLEVLIAHLLQKGLEVVQERFDSGFKVRRRFLGLQEDSETH